MKPLSPVDAISPAFSRTRTLLLPPEAAPGMPATFRFGFFLKIAVVAALTQPSFYGIAFSFFADGLGLALGIAGIGMRHTTPSYFAAGGMSAVVVTVLVALGAIATVFWIVLGWLWCRLRFTLFDLVVYRHGRVGQAWSPYRSPAWRFFGLMFLVALALLLLLAVTAGPLLLHLFIAIRHLTPQEINSDPTLLMSHIFPMYGIIFLFAIVATLAEAVTEDFILPPMAIEDASLGSAFSRFFAFLRERLGHCALYLLLRLVLEVGLTWVGLMAVLVVLGVALVGGGGIGFLLYHFLWHAGPVGVTVFILYCVIAGLLILALYLLLLCTLYGAIALVKQSFAVYFYGSWYRPLGERLEATTAPLTWPANPPLAPQPPPVV
ncbi:MAG TPA: hypothetical protein VHX37_09965 [Acidobacteriaceae bacterium]|jgi:hypothetical protein|nr:hypothetical protein [Acidobacteriaceae bacterium]